MSQVKSPPLAHLVFTDFENQIFQEMEKDQELDDLMDQLFPWDLDHQVKTGNW